MLWFWDVWLAWNCVRCRIYVEALKQALTVQHYLSQKLFQFWKTVNVLNDFLILIAHCRQSKELVKLLGNKRTIILSINGFEISGWWDSRSMDSILPKAWLGSNLPRLELHPVSKSTDTGVLVSFKAPNITDFSILGVVV